MTAPIRDDKPLSEHTEVERQIIRYGFFRNVGRMEEAEECFRKIQGMLRSLPTAAPYCSDDDKQSETLRLAAEEALDPSERKRLIEQELGNVRSALASAAPATAAAPMKRWRCVSLGGGGTMEADDNGDYVRYADLAAAGAERTTMREHANDVWREFYERRQGMAAYEEKQEFLDLVARKLEDVASARPTVAEGSIFTDPLASLKEAIGKLEGEQDGGWSPAAREQLRKIRVFANALASHVAERQR